MPTALSIATVMTATVVAVVVGYRIGRAHAAWRDVRSARRDVPVKRRIAWRHTKPLVLGAAFLLLTFAVAAYDAGH